MDVSISPGQVTGSSNREPFPPCGQMRTLYALPIELLAIEEVTLEYIHILEVTHLPQECASCVGMLHAFRQRYQHHLCSWQALPKKLQRAQRETLLPLHVPSWELVAFCGAAYGYVRFWGMQQPGRGRDFIKHILAFQRRYLDALPPPPRPF
jgi:hypothetical protein